MPAGWRSSIAATPLPPGHYAQIRHKFDKRSRRAAADEDVSGGWASGKVFIHVCAFFSVYAFVRTYSQDDDDDDDMLAEFKDLQGGKDNKVAKVKVSSLRTDLLIKSGLGMARK